MLKLIDLIHLCGVPLTDFKIHCATGKEDSPLTAFFDGRFKEWQEGQNQKNFQCAQILSLIHLRGDLWLFAGVYRVNGVTTRKRRGKAWYVYNTSEVKNLEPLTGRAIVQFEKKFRNSYLRGEKYVETIFLQEIREQRMSVGDFPGYNRVLLPLRMLQTIVRELNPSWKSALSSVAGVYLITDNHNGKLYVGSAYGGEGIWQRWNSYAVNGHGGNKELRQILTEKGNEYCEHFQYSILEVFDLNTSEDYALSREGHWKDVLRSREFGYNGN